MSAAVECRPGARCAACALVVTLAVAASVPLAAQDLGSAPDIDPAWTRGWSPLNWTAELPRTLPGAAGALPDALHWPVPRVGLLWSAGNPGALPLELDDAFSSFRATMDRADGDYRRPLDAGRITDAALRANAWGTFGGSGAAIGRARVSRLNLERALSDFDLAYPGSPYVVMDTAGSELGRTDALLEGSLGWRLGTVGFGVALGYRAQATRTEAAPVPRVLSAADPGASVGMAWAPSRLIRVGVHGRWRAHAERVLLYSVAAPSRVYWLQGYFEARPQDVASGYYQRRMERDGVALNLSLGGEAIGATWAAFVERGSQEERQHPPGENDPDSDTWDSDGWTVGAALSREFPSLNALVVLSGRYTAVSGAARRGDLPDTVTFLADESVFDGAADVIVQPTAALRLLARVTLRREERARLDQLAWLRSDLESWTTGGGVGVEYHVLRSLAFGVAGALFSYGAGGAIPDPADLGVAYRTYVAPEMSLAATDASGWAGSLSLRWAALSSASVWARAQRASLSGSGGVQLPLGPSGERTGWSVEVGIVVRDRN